MTTLPLSFNSPNFPPLHPVLILESKTTPGRGEGMVRKGKRKWLSEMEGEKKSHWMNVQSFNIGQNWFLISEIDQKISPWDLPEISPNSQWRAFKFSECLWQRKSCCFLTRLWCSIHAIIHTHTPHTHKALFCIYNDVQKKADWCYMIQK